MQAVEVLTICVFCGMHLWVSNNCLLYVKWLNVFQAMCCLFIPFIMVESPTWLIANGKNLEAIESLNYIAKVNGMGDDVIKAGTVLKLSNNESKQEKQTLMGLVRKLFKNHFQDLLFCLNGRIIMLYIWFIGYFTAQDIKGNIFVVGLVYSFAEVLTHQIAPRAGNRFGTSKINILF